MIALKRNQPGLLENVVLYFDSFREEIPLFNTDEKDHGRIEKTGIPFVNRPVLAAGTEKLERPKVSRRGSHNYYKEWENFY